MTCTLRPFHLAFPVHDLNAARHFYGEILGCCEGRHSDHWIDFDFFGHQIVAHLDDSKSGDTLANPVANIVDGEQVPVPHFGIILTPTDWSALAERVTAAGIEYIIKPTTRFEGQSGEQSTMFFRDPSGNALEFKAFGNDAMIFAADA